MIEIEEDTKSADNTSVTTNVRSRSSKCSPNININDNIKKPLIENKWTKMLIKYFTTINSMDNSIEIIRSKLNKQKNFSSTKLFKHLDNKSKEYLTINDFKLYLNNNKISFEEKNLRKLIHNFDKDNDFSLNYKEFLGIISPKKEEIKNKNTNNNDKVEDIPIKDENYISNEIKKIFGELITEELKFVEICNELSQKIRNCKDFTTYEAFKEIVGNEKYINVKNLGEYLKNKDLDITDIEINQLMFRIDSDNDGMISYKEFKDIFLSLNDYDYNGYDNNKNNLYSNDNLKKNNKKINNNNDYKYNNDNFDISLPLKISNNNINENFINKENKENIKNEININPNFNYNFDNNYNEVIYNNEKKDITNVSYSLYEKKRKNYKSHILKSKLENKEKNNNIKKNNKINSQINSEVIINKNVDNFYKSSNNNLLDQTKSILGYIQKNNYEEKNNYNNKQPIKNEGETKLNLNIKKKKHKFMDTVLNFDYSKYSKNDEDKDINFFKDKNNNKDNIENYKEKKFINNYDYQKNNLYNSEINFNWQNKSNININEKENNNIGLYNLKYYKKDNEKKDIYKNKYITNEDINYENYNINNINKKNEINNKNKYYNFISNFNKNIPNNNHSNNISNNNSFYKKIKENQKKLNINNSFNTNYIHYNRNTIQKDVEYLYIDSLENSTNKNYNPTPVILNNTKNKYHYKPKLTRNMQDKIQDRKNDLYKLNKMSNSMLNLNYKDKDNSKEIIFNINKNYIDKEKIDNHNRSCFISSFDDKNNLFDIDINNKYNNDDINYHHKKSCCNCIEKRCPHCNCVQATISINDDTDNKSLYENYYKNNINFNSYKNINNKHSSLPKYNYKKINPLNKNFNNSSSSKSLYYIDNKNNNNFKENKSSNKEIDNINKIKNSLYLKKKELLNNKKCILFYNLLIDFLKQDSTIENTRQLLSKCDDANLSDLFELFIHSSNEKINLMDFLQTLKGFGLVLNTDEIKFLFRKFNKNLNESFDYEEFCEIILPKKYSTSKIMSEMKTDNYFFDLSEETKNVICLLFKNIIEGEKSNENFRKIIRLNDEFSGYDLFNKIKKNYSIGIYKEDIANFMKKNKRNLTNKEIELLMDRFDKNKDGMIDYKEFLNEITPMNL